MYNKSAPTTSAMISSAPTVQIPPSLISAQKPAIAPFVAAPNPLEMLQFEVTSKSSKKSKLEKPTQNANAEEIIKAAKVSFWESKFRMVP